LLVATSPFWVVGLERIIPTGERANLRTVIGLVLGFIGLVLLVAPHLSGTSVHGYYLLGAAAIQLGCLSWSAGSVYSKHHSSDISPFMAAAIQMLIAGIALTIIGSVIGEWRTLHFSPRSFSAFVYLIVFGSIVAFGSYTYVIQKLPLTLVSVYSYINPVIAVLLGWLILSEPLGLRVIIAMTIILAAVALVKTAPRRETEQTTEVIAAEPCGQA
jgi:drug/metabolite transporter (DMT)-like permease